MSGNKYIIKHKSRLKPDYKYYHKHHNKFVINKFIDGKMKVFGSVDSEETAKSIVYILFNNDWDIDSLPLKLKEKLKPRTAKNYIYNKGKYSITHTVDGKTTFYGNMDSEEEAKKIVCELKKVDWDVDSLPFLYREKLLSKKPKYYTRDKKSGKYTVQKVIDGKNLRFGIFDSEDEAKDRVDYLKSVGWQI